MSMSFVLEERGEEIILYFDIESVGLNAETFGNALISFDELYRSINAIINPGVDVEIDFIRSEEGSIRAILRSLRKDTKALIAAPFALIVFPFLLNIVSNWATSDSVKIIVNDDSYIVEHGNERIVLPRDAAEKAKKVEKSPSVRRSAKKFFAIVDSDPNVKSIDFRSPAHPNQPVIPIDRSQFPSLRELPEFVTPDQPKFREQPHFRQRLVVVTAVLEKTTRKWQFLWNGQRISADIQDDDFFLRLAEHEYEFGQGDSLLVDLLAEQQLNEILGAYENVGYHITKVHSHTKGPKQAQLL